MTERTPRELDAIVDHVLAYRPRDKSTPPHPEPSVRSVSVERIFSDGELRLDAAHFETEADGNLGYETAPLSDWADVLFIRDRGRKIFTTEQVSGAKPYLSATEFQVILSSSKEPERFISRASDVDYDSFLIRAGWLLVTRSETLGRVFYVTERFDGWFASDDFIRVIPKRPEMSGYLYAWLSHPLAKKQILREGYGGQIDHIDDTHLRTIPVPCFSENTVTRIAGKVVKGMKRRDTALRSIGKSWRKLDAITNHVLTCKPSVKEPAPLEPAAWSLSVERIFASGGLRLDASHFDPGLGSCLEALKSSGLPLSPLNKLATLSLPPRFERVWAADRHHGHPYLNATELLSFFATGMPSQDRYLSHQTNVDMNTLIIRRDWLLMTCSGTIGRVFHVPKRLDGWAATHDLIRVVPKDGMVGYLFAWCMTEAARTQVLAHTHGGQIDHVTDEQVGSMLVPMLPTTEARNLDRSVLRALEAYENGLTKLSKLWPETI